RSCATVGAEISNLNQPQLLKFSKNLSNGRLIPVNINHISRNNLHYWAAENRYWIRTVPNQHPWALNKQFTPVKWKMERWIGVGGAVNWLARSPDLTPRDFFRWPLHPTTSHDMTEIIRFACLLVTPEMIARVENS
ncbi:hypothetical protein D910_10563, partial [Dendroctonus ponderosae]